MTLAQQAKLAMNATFDKSTDYVAVSKWFQGRTDHVGFDYPSNLEPLPCVLYYPDSSLIIITNHTIHSARLG